MQCVDQMIFFRVRMTQTSFVYIAAQIPLTLSCQHKHSSARSIVLCTLFSFSLNVGRQQIVIAPFAHF